MTTKGARITHAGHEDHRADRASEEARLSAGSQHETFAAVLHAYMSRRTLLKGAMASLVLAHASPLARSGAAAGGEGFVPLTHSTEDKLLIPDGYQYNVIIRWGDPVLSDTPAFDPRAQQPAIQARQFGYNADFIGFLPLPAGSANSERGLLVVNHEYTNPELMFADWDGKDESKTRTMVDIELAAHGLSVIEVQRDAKGGWSYVQNSSFNRRLTAETSMALGGPAAGSPRLKTSAESERHPRARNFEQLRRRGDPLGYGAHSRGEFSAVLWRLSGGDHGSDRAGSAQTLWSARRVRHGLAITIAST